MAHEPVPRFTSASKIGDVVELAARGTMDAAFKAWCGYNPEESIFSKVYAKVEGDKVVLRCHEAFCFYSHSFTVEEIMTERANMYHIVLVSKGEEDKNVPGEVGDEWTSLFPLRRADPDEPQPKKPRTTDTPPRFTSASKIGDVVELAARGTMDAAFKAWCGYDPEESIFSKVYAKVEGDKVLLRCHEAFCFYSHSFTVEEIMTERANMYHIVLVAKGEEDTNAPGEIGDEWTSLFPLRRADPDAPQPKKPETPDTPPRFTSASKIGDVVELAARGTMDAAFKAWCGYNPEESVFSKVYAKVEGDKVVLRCHEAFCFYSHSFTVEEIMTERANMYHIVLVAKGEEDTNAPGEVGDEWTSLFPTRR